MGYWLVADNGFSAMLVWWLMCHVILEVWEKEHGYCIHGC